MHSLAEIETHPIVGGEITFALQNGLWINATEVAEKHNKRLDKFWELKATKALISEMKTSTPKIGKLKEVVLGKGKNQGTYIHPELVIEFARWISPKFQRAMNVFVQQHIEQKYIHAQKELELREQELNDCLLEAKTKVVQKDKYIDVLVEERDGKQQEVNRLKKAVSSKSKFREYDGKHGALSKYIRDRGLEVDVSDLFDYLDFNGWVGITIVTERVRHMTLKGEKKYGKQNGKGVPVFSFSELDKTVKTKEFKKFMKQFVNIKKKGIK